MVDKITSPITSTELINKINDIIDNLGSGGGLSYSASCPAITISSGVASWSVTHNLGSTDIVAILYNSSGAEIEKNITVNSANAITVTFKASSNITAGAYRIVVLASGASVETGNLANKDLSNITNAAKNSMSSIGMPSGTYKNLTLGTTGTTYTMPSNGWILFAKRAGASNQWANLTNQTNGLFFEMTANNTNNHVSFLAPVSKSDVIKISYSLTGTTSQFRFYYAVGSESEAS